MLIKFPCLKAFRLLLFMQLVFQSLLVFPKLFNTFNISQSGICEIKLLPIFICRLGLQWKLLFAAEYNKCFEIFIFVCFGSLK